MARESVKPTSSPRRQTHRNGASDVSLAGEPLMIRIEERLLLGQPLGEVFGPLEDHHPAGVAAREAATRRNDGHPDPLTRLEERDPALDVALGHTLDRQPHEGAPTSKDSPQPQVRETLGLSRVKPAWKASSDHWSTLPPR